MIFLKKTTIESDLVVYKISGMLTYLNMPAHLEAAQKIRGNQYVIVSLRHAFYVDAEEFLIFGKLLKRSKKEMKKVFLSGINPKVEKKIRKENFYQRNSLKIKFSPELRKQFRPYFEKTSLLRQRLLPEIVWHFFNGVSKCSAWHIFFVFENELEYFILSMERGCFKHPPISFCTRSSGSRRSISATSKISWMSCVVT